MGFNQRAVPRRRAGSDGQYGDSIRSCTGPQIRAVVAAEVHWGEIELLHIKLANETGAIEAFVAGPRSGDRNSRFRIFEIRGRLPDVGKPAYALQAQSSNLKRLASRQKCVVRTAFRQTRRAVGRA